MKIEPMPSNSSRFVITDDSGKIIDDAQGYGYKTAQNAHKAGWYKFQGGKDKIKQKESDRRLFFRQHPGIEKFINDFYECYFKELGSGEMNDNDLIDEIKEKFGVDMPKSYLHD